MRKRIGLIIFLLVVTLGWAFDVETSFAQKFTPWGWPLPYEKVSQKSIDWCKKHGWWPIVIGAQTYPPHCSGLSLIMEKNGFHKVRGLEVAYKNEFVAGAPILTGLAGKSIAVGGGATFIAIVDKKQPVKLIFSHYEATDYAIFVRPDSHIKKPKDLEGAVIGLPVGSVIEMMLVEYCKRNGVDFSKIKKVHMGPAEVIMMPKGIDAGATWNPFIELMEYRKDIAKFFDLISLPSFGGVSAHNELIENVPDIVQAIVDMHMEATLWGWLYWQIGYDWWKSLPAMKDFPDEPMLRAYYSQFCLMPPNVHYFYLDEQYAQQKLIMQWLHESRILSRVASVEEYENYCDSKFLNKTFEKLGWKKPENPVWMRPGFTLKQMSEDQKKGIMSWPGKIYNQATMTTPIRWPRNKDVFKQWEFAGVKYYPEK
jgi:sulfonate transport system substrate-binding protein